MCVGAFALHPIYDMRYTTGPEIFKADEGHVGGGFHTRYETDITFPLFLKFGLDERWEVGSRLDFQTDDYFAQRLLFADLGVKMRLNSYTALQADVFLGINNDRGGAINFGYVTARRHNRLISALYEARVGFFEAVTGPGGIATVQIGAYPQSDLGERVRMRIGLIASNTVGHFADQFRFDLLPSLFFRPIAPLKIQADFAIGIIGHEGYRLGIYATTPI